MKYLFLLSVLSISINLSKAQDVAVLLKVAENYERDLKETEALNQYKLVLTNDPNNIKALVKTAEISCAIGSRSENKNEKRLQYESALSFSKRALAADNNNADANYAMAMVAGKITEIESDNKKKIALVIDIKNYANKALTINPNHARANFVEGRWHYEMITLNSVKRTAAKLMNSDLPPSSLDSATFYLEKSRQLDPYFVQCYYYLNKAYKEDSKPTKQIEILSKMVKLPTRSIDDIALKADAAKELADLQ